jgi:predicted PurR-regulated permease PerM
MSSDRLDPMSPFYRRVFVLVAAALLGLAVFQIVRPFLQPLAWAAMLALMLHPLQLRLTARLRGRPGLAAIVLTLLVLLMFVGPLTVLAIAFAAQARDLAALTPTLVQHFKAYEQASLATHSVLQDALAWINRYVSVGAAEVQQWALTGAKKMLEHVASLGGSAFFGAVGTVLSFTVMTFLLFFLLRDGQAIASTAIELVPMSPTHKHRLVARLNAVTRAVVLGTIVTAIVQGLLLGIGFAIAGLPAPVVFGVTGAVLSVVPFGGTALVWVPGAAALFLMGQPGWGVFLVAWGVVLVSSADNFLKPLLISGKAEVPTLAIFIGVVGGLSAFGLVGMFAGPILIALLLTLVKFASETASAAPPPAG